MICYYNTIYLTKERYWILISYFHPTKLPDKCVQTVLESSILYAPLSDQMINLSLSHFHAIAGH